MNRDKQIEEMAKVIENGVNICAKKPCEDCDFCGADDCMCQNLVIAKELHTAGYRKDSDVAREIFEEIERLLELNTLAGDIFTGKYFNADLENDLVELKKKYTEGEG